MTITNVSALRVYEFTGGFHVFHALALVSLLTLAMTLRGMLAPPRPAQWRTTHYYWVAWSYAGLSAAGMTEFLARGLLLPGWTTAAAGSAVILLPAALIISRHAPEPTQGTPSGA
jgi:hypothetical protein